MFQLHQHQQYILVIQMKRQHAIALQDYIPHQVELLEEFLLSLMNQLSLHNEE